MNRHTERREGGFTLVEILVCIAVAGIIITLLNSVTVNYLHLSQRGRHLSQSNAFVEAKFEALRNAGYNRVATGTTSLTAELPSKLQNRSGTMTVTEPSAGIKQVVINVSYRDQGQTRSYSYATYIGELGVGQ